jgi:hypothetical protein
MTGEDYGIIVIFARILDIIEGQCRRLNAYKHWGRQINEFY